MRTCRARDLVTADEGLLDREPIVVDRDAKTSPFEGPSGFGIHLQRTAPSRRIQPEQPVSQTGWTGPTSSSAKEDGQLGRASDRFQADEIVSQNSSSEQTRPFSRR